MPKKDREDIVIDFRGQEPVAGGPRFDRVPAGTYEVDVAKAEVVDTSTGKIAVVATIAISKGQYKGKKVRDMFIIPRKGTDDPTFGVQRIHGLMVACGIKKQEGKQGAAKVCKSLTGRGCICEIDDNEMPAQGNYAARTVSAPVAYLKPGSKEAAERAKASKKVKGKEEDEDDEEESDEEDEDSEDDDEEDEDKDEDEDEDDD